MKIVVMMLLAIGTLSLHANSVTLSVERDPMCKSMCNTEIAGQSCLAKGGAFAGPTWLATEWLITGSEATIKTFRIIPTTKNLISVKQVKIFVKNIEGVIEEQILNLGINRIHNCETLIVTMQDKVTITDMELFLRGSAEGMDIGIETAE